MFAWGEDRRQSFRLRKGKAPPGPGVQLLELSFRVAHLCAGTRVLAFTKADGHASVIRSDEHATGGKQKFVDCGGRVVAVSCGGDQVALLCDSGALYWLDSSQRPFRPRPLEALIATPLTQVVCGTRHAVALSTGGQVYTWGQGSRGQLGLGQTECGCDSPQHLGSLRSVPLVRVAAGGEQSFAVSRFGDVFCWGRNDRGQLGLGDTADRHTPTAFSSLNGKKAVSVSCGEEHTAILTKGGAVFTFGSGRHGQLGHGSFEDELCPRLVEELWGFKATMIACGRFHTLVLTDSNKVYSFGRNEQGQLGREDGSPAVPLTVQLPQDGFLIQIIYAGGNGSFATCVPDVRPGGESLAVVSEPLQDAHGGSAGGANRLLPLETLAKKWMSELDSQSWTRTKGEIHTTLSTAAIMNLSFLDRSNDEHFHHSENCSGLDLTGAPSVFGKLVSTNVVFPEVEAAVQKLLLSLDGGQVAVEGLRVFLILNELLFAMQKHRRPRSVQLSEGVAAAVQSLPAESRQILGAWWASLPDLCMYRHLKVWKTALSLLPPCYGSVRNVLHILQNMYNANKNGKIPETAFRSEINDNMLQNDLVLWRQMDVNNPPLIFGSFLFLVDQKSKQKFFDMNCNVTQREHQASPEDPFGLYGSPSELYFELNLNRASFLEDAFRQLAAARPADLKKPLFVYFDGDPKITNVYRQDFFHQLFRNIVKAKPHMFLQNQFRTLAWFSSTDSEESRTDFYLFGILCGLALYNKSIIHSHFPLALFKKLLHVEPTLEDMMEFEPEVGKSLQAVLSSDDDPDIDFVIHWDGRDVDLDPQNPEKPVTQQNKAEFVAAYVSHAFGSAAFGHFERGFFQMCDRGLVQMFGPEELRGALEGQDVYDWARFKKNAQYDGFYYQSHPNILRFWEVFNKLEEEKKKDFLWFLTGFRRVPILGMAEVKMTVRLQGILTGSPDEHRPEALTCYSYLELPLYSSKAVMSKKLMEALDPERGFRAER
ncbi:putative E3 ubiquitin-protein ligase HERC3 [Menidia menidia]